MKRSSVLLAASLALASLLAGCSTAPTDSERAARDQIAQLAPAYPKSGSAGELPPLAPGAPLEDYLRFGVLNHPRVAAAWHDWRASVESIAIARSLPDPQLTFEADIMDTLMTFMPGLMFDVMARGKRTAMADEAAARSGVAYRTYVSAVLRTAVEVRKAWTELAYADDVRRLYEATIRNVDQSVAVAGTEFSTGRGMVSFEQLVRFQNLSAEHHAHHAAIGDRLVAARARFKSALGLARTDADPPWPEPALSITALPSENELWHHATSANPELASMRAMVDMAVAEVAVAERARTPDVGLGLMVDVKSSPLMFRPTASIGLPIWRDKIAAGIAAAEARRDAARARVDVMQLDLAAELAQMLFMVREADRMIAYIDRTALPNIRRVLASAEAGYQSAMGTAAMIPEARHMELTMQLERVNALRERELAAADLLVLFAGRVPADAPLLAETSPSS